MTSFFRAPHEMVFMHLACGVAIEHFACRSALRADLPKLPFRRHSIERLQLQAAQERDPLLEHRECPHEGRAPRRRVTGHSRRVFYTPMSCYGLTGPHRAHLACGLIAHRDNDVHLRRTGPGKFVPRFASQMRSWDSITLQELDSVWIDLPGGMAPGAIRAKPFAPDATEVALGQDASRRIACAEKQNIE